MNEKPRICAFYSVGPHYLRALRRLRETYPGAEITALVPPDYPVSCEERACIDAVEQTALAHYSPRDVAACRQLLEQIRARHFDVFAVLFDSTQLRILAALSRAPVRLHATMDGRLVPLSGSVIAALANAAGRILLGHVVYAAVWLAVHCLPVRGAREK